VVVALLRERQADDAVAAEGDLGARAPTVGQVYGLDEARCRASVAGHGIAVVALLARADDRVAAVSAARAKVLPVVGGSRSSGLDERAIGRAAVSVALPSSQASPGSTIPLPQNHTRTHPTPASAHAKPGSIAHTPSGHRPVCHSHRRTVHRAPVQDAVAAELDLRAGFSGLQRPPRLELASPHPSPAVAPSSHCSPN
jgi:hypothetical protein